MRTTAEEESAYLRSIMDPNNHNLSASQSQRIDELENQLHETLGNYTTLQAKVSQWARASKRNQEGRVAAESIQSVLQEDNQNLQLQLEEAIQIETATRLKYENLNDTVDNYDGTMDDASVNAAMRTAQNRIKGLENNLNQNYLKMENLEKENRRLNRIAEKESEEKKKYRKTIDGLEKENRDLSYVLSSGKELANVQRKSAFLEFRNANPDQNSATKKESLRIEHELSVTMERLNHGQDDYTRLTKTYQETLSELEETKTKNEKLETIIEENGDVIQKLNHVMADKKVLQGTLDNYAHKMQQKQLSIEMLEKHLSSAKERLVVMDQQAEDSEDLKYLLEDEKIFNLELQKKVQNLTLQSYANQDKIKELSNQSKNQSSKTVIGC
jgi:chromosome segregation ATPase